MNRLTGPAIVTISISVRGTGKSGWPQSASGVANDCEQQSGAYGFLRLYEEIFALDAPISAAFACELRLIDSLVDNNEPCLPFDKPSCDPHTVEIPEWRNLFPPTGEIARADLCRHVMAFGETGSEKTKSAIIPVLKGILRQADPAHEGICPVSCALVHRSEEGAFSDP